MTVSLAFDRIGRLVSSRHSLAIACHIELQRRRIKREATRRLDPRAGWMDGEGLPCGHSVIVGIAGCSGLRSGGRFNARTAEAIIC